MIEKDLKQLRVDLQDFKERLEADDGVWYEEDLTTLSYAVELIDNLRNKQHKQMNKFLNGIINNNLKTFQLLSKKGKLEQHDYFEIIGKHNEFYDKEILSLYDYIEKLQDEKDVQALQVSHIKDRIQDLQNAKTATEITEHAKYFVTLVRSSEQLEKENYEKKKACRICKTGQAWYIDYDEFGSAYDRAEYCPKCGRKL